MSEEKNSDGLRRTLTIVGIVLTLIGSGVGVASWLFQTTGAAAEHEQVFTQHVGHFDTHVARSQVREEMFVDLREELKLAAAFRHALHINQTAIMTKMNLKAVEPKP